MSVNMNSGPTVAELKEQFKSRSIPLESDFSDLIDIADYGRKAVGLSPQQSPNQSCGLALDNEGQLEVKIKADGKLLKDTAGIGIVPEQQFSAGMIMMFSGGTVPAGWALCNGDTVAGTATPDLRKRFIIAGELGELAKSRYVVQGSGSYKKYGVSTNSRTAPITVTVNYHALTTSQIPSHKHLEGSRYSNAYDYLSKGVLYGHRNISNGNHYKQDWSRRNVGQGSGQIYTSSVGSSGAHKHSTTVSQRSHNHSVDCVTPYYTLAFIIKL